MDAMKEIKTTIDGKEWTLVLGAVTLVSSTDNALIGGIVRELEKATSVAGFFLPEAYSHPSCHARVLEDLMKIGPVIIGTHSEQIFDALRIKVLRGEIPAEEVSVYHLSRTTAGVEIDQVIIRSDGKVESTPTGKGFFGEQNQEDLDVLLGYAWREL
jgi:predicted ATPase